MLNLIVRGWVNSQRERLAAFQFTNIDVVNLTRLRAIYSKSVYLAEVSRSAIRTMSVKALRHRADMEYAVRQRPVFRLHPPQQHPIGTNAYEVKRQMFRDRQTDLVALQRQIRRDLRDADVSFVFGVMPDCQRHPLP